MITKTPLFNAEGDEIGHMETYINEEFCVPVSPEEEAAIDQAVAEDRIFYGRSEAALDAGEAAGTELEGLQRKRIKTLQAQVQTLRGLIEAMSNADIGDCPKPIVLGISTQFCEMIDEHIGLRQDFLRLLQAGNKLSKSIRSHME